MRRSFGLFAEKDLVRAPDRKLAGRLQRRRADFAEIASKVIRLFREIRPPERAEYRLTPYETRLLKLLVEGHSYKTAAAELNGKVNTVAFHMKSIYRKLHVHSKSEAVAKALQQRLI
jgi:DNA-binding CsgD family transcriptional regulator